MWQYVSSTSSHTELLHHKEIPPSARRVETLLTLNQTQQAPDIQTRPTLRRSAVGRGKLRASRRSLLQSSSTSRARPSLALTRSSLLESPNTLLTNKDIAACLRTQLTADACVLTSTNTAVSSYSPREHLTSLRRCTRTESHGRSPKTTRTGYQQRYATPANRDKHECSKYTTPSGSHPQHKESES